ncbi:hypothetical protein DYB32_005010 [Aphanomyces invadans]|uniref:Uncharacterized protein n=1 Tax=Aphanomyces invadans TaxID=157072 RepID=A0A418AVW5_9STRA|nr:hypothetical protein DYB32_005010 [Aphanomyces invadans]
MQRVRRRCSARIERRWVALCASHIVWIWSRATIGFASSHANGRRRVRRTSLGLDHKALLEENAVLQAQVAALEVELQRKHDLNNKLQYESQFLTGMLARLDAKEIEAGAKLDAVGREFVEKEVLQEEPAKRQQETLKHSIADLDAAAREYDRLTALERQLLQQHATLTAECEAMELQHKAELQARKVDEYNRKRTMDQVTLTAHRPCSSS